MTEAITSFLRFLGHAYLEIGALIFLGVIILILLEPILDPIGSRSEADSDDLT